MGVRLRTTLTATAAVAVALCLASIALFAALNSSLANSTKETALQDAQEKASLVVSGGSPPEKGGSTAALRGSTLGPPPERGLGTTSGTTSSSAPGTAAGTGKGYFTAHHADGKLLISKIVRTKNGQVTVTGAASTAPARAAMTTLTRLLIPGIPLLLGLVALFTWLAVGRALRPVSAIRAKLADITAHDLHERVPEPDARDEIATLARTVNATLDRLRTAVDAHRQFVADAAHELRSPMAVLRTRLELARPCEKQLAADALDDVERLQSLTADLLLLARLDAREPVRGRELDLA
jgi:signal transduction histidine kinase